ncbi:acyl-CoA synthetase [Embleya scabrispora]|uniref:Acyl-CoA synthetase n=1 Tax=Embleya scabrispora TaxID=159449 RepID=A0A1T3P409_9ACTN|nr:AMP-binding protein [Embleya scabrispora]OPC83691.1 acyl-CoA synthetase [Embleya scabrispora]
MHPGVIAAAHPDRPAVILAGSGRVVTYAELDAESNRFAHLLYDAGLRPGDHLAIALENHPLCLAITWAAQRSGLIYTPVSVRLHPDELAYVVDNCGARVFVSSAAVGELADAVLERAPRVERRLMLDGARAGFEAYEEAVRPYPSTPIAVELEGVDMLYSSGTTGRPKGVLPRREDHPLGSGPAVTLYRMLGALYGMDTSGAGGDVYLCPAPLYHAAPLRYCMQFLRGGHTVVVLERFDAEAALAAIERYRVTHSQWVPTMFVRMLKLPAEVRNRHDLSSLRYAVHASAPCPPEVKERMLEWWGPVLYEYYAGTEANGYVACTPEEWLTHRGTVGRAILGTLHVCDEQGRELPVGEDGVVYFADGPQFTYHEDPAKTEAGRDPGGRGWTTLGDIGHLDADGFLYLTDRQSHLIISGGVNIYPQEVENLLALHPAIADVAVLGVPDADLGEQVKAVVQPAEGAVPGPELAEELIAYCRARLAHYKCPRSVDFRPSLPRRPTGKLYKRLLVEEYERS